MKVCGKNAEGVFARESGGHRWQRIPPTEKRGRVQTSTITVVVLPAPDEITVTIDERDLRWSTCRASGNGGQHLAKTESAVQLEHLPSGIHIRCQNERSQHQNRATALALLRARLFARTKEEAASQRAAARKEQAGCGERGDKRRTVREQDGLVHDHQTGQTWSFRDYERGKWELA